MYFEQVSTRLSLFFILYGGAAVAALLAGLYLWLRKGNAFATDITPPLPARRWASAFFFAAFMSHVWWYLFYIYSNDFHSVSCLLVASIDCVGLLTTIAGMLFAMLQDRKRRIWPVALGTIPYIVLGLLHVLHPDRGYINMAVIYLLAFYGVFTIYMIYAVRQYGRWLRNNYADLEHKEVWVSQVLVFLVLILIICDGLESSDVVTGGFLQVVEIVFFGLLLWRIETLPKLENAPMEWDDFEPAPDLFMPDIKPPLIPDLPFNARRQLAVYAIIEQLLEERCVSTQLYLQHDLTLQQLAQVVGTNRSYLGQYFTHKGVTYNAYINNLRISHFLNLYRQAAAKREPILAQDLANDSGYRSYSTFSLAFKKRMGQSVSTWIRERSMSEGTDSGKA